jgi:hypothetical protein
VWRSTTKSSGCAPCSPWQRHPLAGAPWTAPVALEPALDQECAAIEHELKLTPGRDEFELRSKWAVTVDDLMRHLLDLQPTIVHFSGHGHTTGLVLVGDDGRPQLVAPAALKAMIRTTMSS